MALKKIKIDFCESNVHFRSKEAFQKLQAADRTDIDVHEWGCLGNCELCEQYAYAVVGDKFVKAAPPLTCWPYIAEAVAEKKAAQAAKE